MQRYRVIPADAADRHARILAVLALGWMLVLTLFHALPGIDLAASSLFCAGSDDGLGTACIGFPAREHWLARIFRGLFYWAPVLAIVALVGDLARQYTIRRRLDSRRSIEMLVAVAAFLTGPILLVNGVLKAFSGRPRPHETLNFGGSLDFIAAGDFSGACTANCSFVSGEAAAAGWLICLLPLLKGRWRYLVGPLLVDISIGTPLLRVAMGGHYLSDAILGWLIGAGTGSALAIGLVALSGAWPKAISDRNSATLDRAG
jgi:membrane-associated phospholipid phosphatase